jgi:hypothetical protein
MALVFQYGSNTSSSRLNSAERLAGDAKDLGLVRTDGTFELCFNVWSTTNRCGAADIREGAGRVIWGILYEIPDYLIDRATSGVRRSLDAIEGAKYERRTIVLLRPDGTRLEDGTITYTVRTPQIRLKTSLEYASHILAGLREHRAPDDYIAYVKNRVVLNHPGLERSLEGL